MQHHGCDESNYRPKSTDDPPALSNDKFVVRVKTLIHTLVDSIRVLAKYFCFLLYRSLVQ